MKDKNPEVLLTNCRDLVAERMSVSVLHTLNDVEHTLYNLAMREKFHGKANNLYDAVRKIKSKKNEIRVRFEKRFTSLFDYSKNTLMEEIDDASITLSNIGHKSYSKNKNIEEILIIENSINKVRKESRFVLLHLDNKVSNLLKDIEVNDSNNPMKPETVFEAFWESCRDIDLDSRFKKLLLGIFEKYVLLDLYNVYEDLNNYLDTTMEEKLFNKDKPVSLN